VRCLKGEVQLRIDILSPEQVLEYTDGFSLPKIYIERDALYRQNWLHLTDDDYTNDAFVYIMPSETHNIPNGIWVSVFEVRDKGKGFGTKCIDYLKSLAQQLHKNSLALHAKDKSAKLFYLSNGFNQINDFDDLMLSIG